MKFASNKLNNTFIKGYLTLFIGVILLASMIVNDLSVETSILITSISVFFLIVIFFSQNLFNPFCFLFIYSFLGFIDVTMVATGVRSSFLSVVPNYVYNKTLFIMLLWFLTFSVGYGIVYKLLKKNQGIRKIKIKPEIDINPHVIFVMCGAIFFYSLLSTVKNSIKLGGLVQGMSGGGAAFADQGYLLALLGFAGCLPVIALYSGKKWKAIMYVLIVFIGILITGRRSMAIITAILPFAVYWNAMLKKIRLSYIVLLAVPLLMIILYIGAIRTAENPNFTKTNTNNYYLTQLSILARYNGYGDNIPAMINKIDNGGLDYQGFNNALRGIEYFIPRSLWPEKPLVHSSQIVSNTVFFAGDTGRPVNAYGWAYFHFGYLGVILSGLLTGSIVSYFYYLVMKKRNVVSLCMYSLLILPVLEVFQPEAQMKIVLFTITLKTLEIVSRKTKGSRKEALFLRTG